MSREEREKRKEERIAREKEREQRLDRICNAIKNYRFMSGTLSHLRAYGPDKKLIEEATHFAIEKHVPTAGFAYVPINEGDVVIVIKGEHVK